MKITRGRVKKALKIVLYGPEGIGKSTLAAQFPGAVFIDTEDSTAHMDVARFEKPSSWQMIKDQADWVRAHPGEVGTLIIDTCESALRTEANFATGWFGRIALALGPLTGLLLLRHTDYPTVFLAAMGCAVVSLMLVLLVKFPFRTPDEDVSVFCLDRFFLPHGTVLFMNLLLVTVAFGLLLSMQLPVRFFAMMMGGLIVALLCWRFVFRDADLKSEVVTGLILLGAALIMMLTRSLLPIVSYAAPTFIGVGMGLIGSRFLLFFIKLSRHCQRGTSQSTFMLGWESGIALGIGLGLGCFNGMPQLLVFTSLLLVVFALTTYQFSHNWFIKNKNR